MSMCGPLNNAKSLMTLSDWSEAYPKSDYNKTPHGKKHYLAYAMIHSKEETIISSIGKLRSIKALTQKDPKVVNLTPLAIACMRGRLNTVIAILNRFQKELQDINCTRPKLERWMNKADTFGWTPLHHATLTSEEIFNALSAAGANIHLKTNRDGTCNDIRRLTTIDVPSSSACNVKIETEAGIFTPLLEVSREELKRLTGLETYRDDPFFSSDQWGNLWKNQTPPNPFFDQFHSTVLSRYNRMIEAPPALTIGENEELKQNGVKAYEVRADQFIPKGTFVGQYGGSCEKPQAPDYSTFASICSLGTADPYEFAEITGQHHGNVTRFFNNGFPNVYVHEADIHGTGRKLFIAFEDIQPGEPIVWDYGLKSEIGWTRCSILREAALKTFCKNPNPFVAKHLRNLSRKQSDPQGNCDDTINFASQMGLTLYPVNNATVMLYLHLSKLFDIEQSKKNIACKAFFAQQGSHGWLLHAVAERISEFQQVINNYPIDEQAVISNFILSQIGILDFAAILKLIMFVINESPNTVSENLIKEQALGLREYKAIEDPEFSLSVDYVTKSTITVFDVLNRKNQADADQALGGYYFLQNEFSLDPVYADSEFAKVVDKVIAHSEATMPPREIDSAKRMFQRALQN